MTVSLWRIATEAPDYAADDLRGTGAKLTGGRWNRPGVPMIYTSTNIALACLETIVHLSAGSLPLNRYLVRIDVTDQLIKSAEYIDAHSAPVGWDAQPAGKTSFDFGTQWGMNLASALLFVPSIVVPEEYNVLINPLHPDSSTINAVKVRRWIYDARVT